jgi:hypothetical protein
MTATLHGATIGKMELEHPIINHHSAVTATAMPAATPCNTITTTSAKP